MKFAYFVDALSLKYLNHKSHKDSILFLHHHHSLSFSPRQLQSMPYHCPIPDTAYTNIHSARSDGSSTAIRSSSTSSSTQHSLDRIAITEINMQVYLIKPQCVYSLYAAIWIWIWSDVGWRYLVRSLCLLCIICIPYGIYPSEISSRCLWIDFRDGRVRRSVRVWEWHE